MCPRAWLLWKEKYEILVECRERGITKGFEQIESVCEWAAQKFHLKKEPSYCTINGYYTTTNLLLIAWKNATATQKSE